MMTKPGATGAPSTPRRRILTLVATFLGAGLASSCSKTDKAQAPAPARTLLDPNEPEAKAIAYIENAANVDANAFPTYRRGQSCATCALIEFGTARARGCTAVPGRLVLATGWCNIWQLRGS